MKETLLHVPQEHPQKVELTQKAGGLNRVKRKSSHGPPQDMECNAETETTINSSRVGWDVGFFLIVPKPFP
ncbi:hypothetical protein, partial [Salmonella enterica]|uniref:hypothetical protein n=1 Tax=Salmonella enterica TaxID=28901 RepID=UPI00329975A1